MQTVSITEPKDVPKGAQLDARIRLTTDKLGAWIPGSDHDSTVFNIGLEYSNWLEGGRFVTPYGFFVDSEIDAKAMEEVLPRIPSELGFDSQGKIALIHFTPGYLKIDKNGGQEVIEETVISEPKEDQKYLTITQGLSGALDYITLIEAGLLPKPDYLIGYTNPTMANFAKRAGFKNVSSIVDKMSRDKDVQEDIEPEEEIELADRIDYLAERFYLDKITRDESEEAVLLFVRLAAMAKKGHDEETYETAISMVNAFLINEPVEETELVWCKYEDFRDAVLRFNKKFGKKIVALASLEMDKFKGLKYADEIDDE